MKQLVLSFLLLGYSFVMNSQEEAVPTKKTQKGFVKIDFLSIDMPVNSLGFDEADMGFTGIHYNLTFKKFYAGLGIYSSITGLRGGFFTLGINAGYKKKLTDYLFLDTGFHFGGGGGAGAPDGGGAFILPHFNVSYQLKPFSLNVGYNYINFFDGGNIKSHQLHLGLEIPISFNYSNYKAAEKKFSISDLKKTTWNKRSKRISLMVHFNNLAVIGNSKNTKGLSLKGKTIRLSGFELSSYLHKNFFLFLKADGAYHGIKAGYMDIFLGTGYQFSFNKRRTNILGKFAIGAGGGGGVDTQGGFLIAPDIAIEQKLFSNFFISMNKGYLMSPNSHFISTTFGLGFKYYMNNNGIISTKNFHTGRFKGIEMIVKQDLYFKAERETNPTEDLHQISLQINFKLNKHFYFAGQTSFANFGNAGAYAEGIVGLGVQSNQLINNINFFTQILTGAAGGGNISTGQGFILKPSFGINYKLSPKFSLYSATGYVKALNGELNSTFFNFGLKYQFSFLTLF